MSATNKNVVMIAGAPNTGKTFCLKGVVGEQTVYLNADMKELSFDPKGTHEIYLDDYTEISDYLEQIEDAPEIEFGVLDTINMLFELIEEDMVMGTYANDTQKGWQQYGFLYNKIMRQIKSGTKNFAVLTHVENYYDDSGKVVTSKIPIKGAKGRRGIDADFSIILQAKCLPIKELKKYPNKLLTITDEEEEDGFKYVLQTRRDKRSINEIIRCPDHYFSRDELYIDNNLALLFKRINEVNNK